MKIVISGLSGCGATTISKLVSKRLKIKNVNYTFKELAKEKNINFSEVQKNALKDKTDFILDSKILRMARGDFVLASRLACWLSDYNLSVWLEANVETRAKRIAERENKVFKNVLSETIQRDRENIERYKKIYGINPLNHPFVDLIINVERFSAFETAELISKTAVKMKLKKNVFSSIIENKIKKKQ
jgi:cytidylate kinase